MNQKKDENRPKNNNTEVVGRLLYLLILKKTVNNYFRGIFFLYHGKNRS